MQASKRCIAYLRGMKKYLAFPLLLSLLFVQSCTPSAEKYASEIEGIDSLLTELNASMEVFKSIPSDEVSKAFKQMNDDLKQAQFYLQDSTVTIEEATLFSEYTSARRLVKDFPERMRSMPQEYDRTIHQLSNLKQALESGATHDQLGNKIDDAYVQTQYAMERKLAESLARELRYTEDYATRAMKAYAELEPQVRNQIALWTTEE